MAFINVWFCCSPLSQPMCPFVMHEIVRKAPLPLLSGRVGKMRCFSIRTVSESKSAFSNAGAVMPTHMSMMTLPVRSAFIAVYCAPDVSIPALR